MGKPELSGIGPVPSRGVRLQSERSRHIAILSCQICDVFTMSDVIAFYYLLLCSILLRYQGNVLLTNHVRALHRNLLRAGVVGLNHRCRVADIRVINGI